MMYFIIILFGFLLNNVQLHDLCSNVKENLCNEQDAHTSIQDCSVETLTLENRECSTVTFSGTEKLKNDLDALKLQAKMQSSFALTITFSEVHWKKAYLKLSEYNKTDPQFVCKMLSVGSAVKLPINSMYDECFAKSKYQKAKDYLLEVKAERKHDVSYRKLLFSVPNNYNNDLVFENRPLFFYIDFTDSNVLLLKIQTNGKYNVSSYKIEVFKEKNAINLVDVRLIAPKIDAEEISFEYITFNEEGYYYFAISVISGKCPEDKCSKTVTPKIYISRKGTPLVIGIVGASCIIPFVLFLFYILNRKFKDHADPMDPNSKILFIYKSTPHVHNEVVVALAKLLKNLTGIEVILDPIDVIKTKKGQEKWCNDNLLLASHIVYVSPPIYDTTNCDLDYLTYNFLKEETKKSLPEKDIITICFPYSTSDIPPIFVNCLRFDLLDDFGKFVNIFNQLQSVVNFESNCHYLELVKKIKAAQFETDLKKYRVTPKIIITEQSDSSDNNEPNEGDGLL